MFTQPLIKAQIKENIKAPRHWPLCRESPVTGEFPAQRANNAENVSIWWRHHVSLASNIILELIKIIGFGCDSCYSHDFMIMYVLVHEPGPQILAIGTILGD